MGPAKFLISLAVLEVLLTGIAETVNILAIFPNAWKSHYIFGRAILSELAMRGHNITLISAYADLPEENLTEIELYGIEQNWIEMGLSFGYDEIRSKSAVERLTKMIDVGTANADLILSSEEMQKLLFSEQRFDLFFVDLCLSEALLGAAYYLHIPTVVVGPSGTNNWLNEMTGNPHNSALDPSSFLPFMEEMSLLQRILNTLMNTFEKLSYIFFHMLCQESVYKRHFESMTAEGELPPLRKLVRAVNLVLINSHPITNYPRPYVANMIEVGGIHTHRRSGMSKEIAQFIEGAQDGVVYISFGANLRTIDLPKEKLTALVTALYSLKNTVRVIIKWEQAYIEDQPSNVYFDSWLPQQAILAHKKVKLFITTGGLLSIMEAVKWKCPMLGIPISSDQEVNIMRMERAGCAVKLRYEQLTAESLLNEIEKIWINQSYHEHIAVASSLFQDNLNQPMDKAIYYINLVLKSYQASYLQSKATKMSFIETEMIDVLVIILAGIFTILAVPSVIICAILKKANNYKPNWVGNSVMNDEGRNKKHS